MSNKELLEYIKDEYPEALLANGFDSAIIGVCGGFDSGRVAYSVPKMIEVFMEDNDCDYEEAVEYIDYNVLGSYVGKNTPIYIESYKE